MNQSRANFGGITFDIPFNIVMEKIEADRQWSLDRWNLVGAILENGAKPKGEVFKGGGRHIFCWPGFRLNVHARHVRSYCANLQTGNPKLFVICRSNNDGLIYPAALSVDIDEAAAYMEADEPVFSCPLPEPAVDWLEKFASRNRRPAEFVKRCRQTWHTAEIPVTENVNRPG